MEDISKFIYINELFTTYGKLLTPKQQEVVRLYYQLDYSLQEISENLSVSRAAVSDALKSASIHLEKFEHNLGIVSKKARLNKLIDSLEITTLNQEQRRILNDIKKELE